ncbi:MAG: hypothetical protein NC331_14985 [Lachnospiraceae bacterium]|nr:hypothetical protein [Lachnospiraceae bacterium]MCM1240667.1 hypothetical protein [Lachnospiraceae bacterium]
MSFSFGQSSSSSSLFSSMGGSNFLTDYASIKNGSYGRLMKSYYSSAKSSATGSSSSSTGTSNVLEKILEEKRNPKVSKDTQESNAKLTTGLSSLQTTVAAMQSSKTYTDTTNGQSAEDKAVSAVKTYVEQYNDVVTAAKGSTLTNKTAYVANMMSATAAKADKLAEIGVTVDSNGTLMLNEAKLKEAGASKVQELFSSDDIMSYGSVVASRLQFAGASSSTDAVADSKDTSSTAASSASSLKTDSKALGSDDLYAKVKDKDGNEKYDIDKILGTAKSFVNNYNNMFNKAESSTNSGVLANLSYIRETTARNEDALKQFGFSVDQKGRMKLDEDTFKKSDMSEVQKFFKDYGSSVSTNASLVDYYMTTQANAASGYTADGVYNVQGSSRYADAF